MRARLPFPTSPRTSHTTRARRIALTALAAAGLLLSACGDDTVGVSFCEADDECSSGERCIESICVDPDAIGDVIDPDGIDIPEGDTTDTGGGDDTTDTGGDDTTGGDTTDTGGDDTTDAVDMTDLADMSAVCGNDTLEAGEACDGAQLGTETCATQGFDGGTLACAADCMGFDTAACTTDTCGNGTLDAGETCDGTELDGQDCTTQGFDGGTLACNATCDGFDPAGCMMDTCGDGTIDAGEDCEDTDLAGATCQSLGQGFTGGTLACSTTCQFDTAGCTAPVCGNDTLEAGEICDGAALNNQDCTTQGFDGGTLACAADCMGFDTTACTTDTCGDGTVDASEDCDGADLDGGTCTSEGFDGGTLVCNADCTFNTTACTINTCGNGMVNMGEACDGMNLDGADCTTLGQGFTGGVLTCGPNCQFNTTACTSPVCGNMMIEGSEVCDGTALAGEDCVSQGFDGGTLACATDCSGYDTTACTTNTCGNGMLDGVEQCDGNNLDGETCSSQGFVSGTLACSNTCTFDTSGCASAMCGNNAAEAGEACDGTDLAGQSCASRGFDGGTLACTANCGFDESGCTTCGNGMVEAGEQCDDGNTTPGDGCDATCQTETAGSFTVRFTNLELRDPHLFVLVFGVLCFDGIDQANGQIATAVTSDGDMDGYYDLSLVTQFTPLDQDTATPTPIAAGAALCSATANTCAPDPASPLTTSTYTSFANPTSPCLQPIMGTTGGYSPAITSPENTSGHGCFVSDQTTLTVDLGGIQIPLTNAQIGGEFDATPATGIDNGLVMGFLAESVADTVIVDLGQGDGPQPISRYLPGGTNSCEPGTLDSVNGVDGWWFYLNFEAAEVTWTP